MPENSLYGLVLVDDGEELMIAIYASRSTAANSADVLNADAADAGLTFEVQRIAPEDIGDAVEHINDAAEVFAEMEKEVRAAAITGDGVKVTIH